MENKNLETAAQILKTSVERLNDFGQEITDEMSAVVEMITPDTPEQAQLLYSSLLELWQKGIAHECMVTISKETGANLDTLLSLDIQSQMMIDWEYTMAITDGDSKRAVSSVYDNIRRALAIIELPDVAKLLGMEYDKLRLYSREIWEQLCGAYAMEYEENGDNSELIAELKEILDEAEENTDE